MPEYKWPEASDRDVIGKPHTRTDGPDKVTGRARYTMDKNLPGMLQTAVYRAPYAHARLTSIDISAAKSAPGVKAVKVLREPNTPQAEVLWHLEDVAVVAAETEEQARDAVRKIKAQWEKLPHFVKENDLKAAGERAKAQDAQVTGDPDAAFKEADVVVEGYYGTPLINHCCLEPHGTVADFKDGELTAWISTQAVTGVTSQFAKPLELDASKVIVRCDHMGGGFGSKFGADLWGVEAARLSRETGRPVKYMLERAPEQAMAGSRPSDFAKIKVGAKKDGTIVAWESETWGTNGPTDRGAAPPLPYVFRKIPNARIKYTGVATNFAPTRAWRAPNHPQAAVLTMCALEDLAAKLNRDPLDFFIQNIELTQGGRPEDYVAELKQCAEMIGWKKNWHPRGDKTAGPIKRGLGLSIHTWGGRGHNSQCDVRINSDGSVSVSLGSQDLGVGTRTVIAMVAAETVGLTVNDITVNLGDNRYPPSGGSGGSTTVGGVCASTRRGSQDAVEMLFAKVAPVLGVPADQLEAEKGKVQVKGNPGKSLTWKQACAKIGPNPIVTKGVNPGAGQLTDANVAGAQMADVSVDIETGVVRINRFVAAQDIGLVINPTTAASQVYGAMIQGVCYALMEERVADQMTGRILNNDMEFYKLAGIGDIGDFQVHLMTGKGFDERGVIGIGEPPVVSPGAAISNAVANAIGVRVPEIPLTPDRVLAALEKGGVA